MADIFEYDVFLSFASADEEIVKPIWQELCLSGLRIFWSNASLKNEVGNSWFDVIQSSLEKSRHLLLFCSPASMSSKWVQREYSAFFSHCYTPRVRRLVPILLQGYKISDLPLFFKDIEAWQLGSATAIKEIISILGGVDIEELKFENEFLKQNLESLSQENSSLEVEIKRLNEQLKRHEETHESDVQTESKNSLTLNPEPDLCGGDQSIYRGAAESEKKEAFKSLALSSEATSQEIEQRYEALKTEYETLISNCSKGLKDICELRLQILENAFGLVFHERKREEDQKVERAFEMLQLSKGADRTEIRNRLIELKVVCLTAMKSSDTFIKEAAAKELEKLEEASPLLIPTLGLLPQESSQESEVMTEVVFPQMGESILEGVITKWLKKEGERIERDEPLFEISTDKVDAEIPSPETGILKTILAAEGETVPVNIAVALISRPSDHLPQKNGGCK